jgi:hypothetical protein
MSLKNNCRIEIQFIDPEVYTSIVNHPLRKELLHSLYVVCHTEPATKQQLADHLNVGYHQIVYQLNNHLNEFWQVVEEQKVRGTRMELIGPAHPDTIYITLGKGNGLFMFDPMANLFGPLYKVGTRCDLCSPSEARRCVEYATNQGLFKSSLTETEQAIMIFNGRKMPMRTIEQAIIFSLRGVPEGNTFSIEFPCDACPFKKRLLHLR